MEETDNHVLNTYTSGETGWTHSPDMEHIEERLTVRDTEANLSNYTPHAGAEFIATDTGVVYDGDGGSWNKSTREYGESIADSVRAQGSPFYDVMAFGAEGDANTDDTTAIQDTIDAAGADGGGTVFLPSGTYVTSDIIEVNDSDVRIVGPDATISPPGTYEGWVFDVNEIDKFAISGLTFDMQVSGQGFRPITAHVNDRLLIEDIEVVGTYDGGSTTSEGILHVNIIDEGGSGIVRNFRATDGSVQDTSSGGTWGVLTPAHVGQLTFKDCHFHGWADNGIYSSGDGKAIVEGGTFKNNGNSNVRFHGDGSVVRDATLTLDTDFAHGNSRCVWLRGGEDHRVENCEILIDSGAGDQTPISVHGDVPSADIVSTDIEINSHAQWLITGLSTGTTNKGVTFRDCNFHGSPGVDNGDDFMRINRERVVFDGCWADVRNDTSDKSFARVQAANVTFRNGEFTSNNPTIDVRADGCILEDMDCTATDFGRSIRFQVGAADCIMRDCAGPVHISDAVDLVVDNHAVDGDVWDDGGVRTIQNGSGVNAGDPTSTGDWNGNGVEGIVVRDTANTTTYAYLNDGWVTL